MGKKKDEHDLDITLEESSDEAHTETDTEQLPDVYSNHHYTFVLLWSCRIISLFTSLILSYNLLQGTKILHSVFMILFQLVIIESILQSFEFKENLSNSMHFYIHSFLSGFGLLNLILGVILILTFGKIELNSVHSWLGFTVLLIYFFVFLFGIISYCRENQRLKIIHEIGGILLVILNSIIFCLTSKSLIVYILYCFFILIFFSLIFRKNHVNLRRDQEDFIGNPLLKDIVVQYESPQDRGFFKTILRLFC